MGTAWAIIIGWLVLSVLVAFVAGRIIDRMGDGS